MHEWTCGYISVKIVRIHEGIFFQHSLSDIENHVYYAWHKPDYSLERQIKEMSKKDTRLQSLSETIHIRVEELRGLGIKDLDWQGNTTRVYYDAVSIAVMWQVVFLLFIYMLTANFVDFIKIWKKDGSQAVHDVNMEFWL